MYVLLLQSIFTLNFGMREISNKSISTLNLKCLENTHVSTVKFASFGNRLGSCRSYLKDDCHDPDSTSMVEKVNVSEFLLLESNWNDQCLIFC